MEFSIVLLTKKPKQYNVLDAETPISGLRFLEIAGMALRRSLDTVNRYRHQTLGTLSSYTMKVPQQMAIDSGLFEETAKVALVVSEDILSHFIFYSASLGNSASHRPCYPYTQNEITLTSLIDELTFLSQWAATNYATKLKVNDQGILVPDTDDDEDEDDKKKHGCPGCPVPFNPYDPGCRPGGWPPPPQPTWWRPGPNTPYYPNQPPYPPAPPAPDSGTGSGASRPTGTSETASTSGIRPGTIMLGEDILTDEQFNALFD